MNLLLIRSPLTMQSALGTSENSMTTSSIEGWFAITTLDFIWESASLFYTLTLMQWMEIMTRTKSLK